jgi:CBS domain-containing protein
MDHAKARRLPVRRRRILTGSGEAKTVRTVSCPAHGDAVPLSMCADCSRAQHFDRAGNEVSAVVCVPALGPEPHSGWSHLLHRILPSAADRVTIAEAMAREVTCVTSDVSVETLEALFVEENVAAVPVVDDDGFPIGLVSKSDLVRAQYENGDTRVTSAPLAEGLHETAPRGTVTDVMTPLAYTLRETDPLSRAAAVMAMENVHQLPVVDGEGRVVGMIESLDFVRWIASQSAYADEA